MVRETGISLTIKGKQKSATTLSNGSGQRSWGRAPFSYVLIVCLKKQLNTSCYFLDEECKVMLNSLDSPSFVAVHVYIFYIKEIVHLPSYIYVKCLQLASQRQLRDGAENKNSTLSCNYLLNVMSYYDGFLYFTGRKQVIYGDFLMSWSWRPYVMCVRESKRVGVSKCVLI